MSPFVRRITAGPEHIDVLGHVNNPVWLAWIQEKARVRARTTWDEQVAVSPRQG